ncbi:hypothetical protein RRG08_022516 [Elysia crispata]|uniref:Uncharacterized protein n=1 Tax=Elysia crispata TaxID=231223 RepID=A0AAE0Z3D0_9GAST|nr:hypothetical protein RRG08_022516 [Elysia crispata]
MIQDTPEHYLFGLEIFALGRFLQSSPLFSVGQIAPTGNNPLWSESSVLLPLWIDCLSDRVNLRNSSTA